MYFASNLQFLRKRSGRTQEKLAHQLGVSRQAISKWESGEAVPELHTLMELADLFSCKLDELLRSDLTVTASAVKILRVKSFSMVRYTLISPNAREDIRMFLTQWATEHGIGDPKLLLWRFPYVTEEQRSRFGLDGFEAACVLPDTDFFESNLPFSRQGDCTYARLTLPGDAGRAVIAQGIRTILEALQELDIRKSAKDGFLPCFEWLHEHEGEVFTELFLQCADAETTEEFQFE